MKKGVEALISAGFTFYIKTGRGRIIEQEADDNFPMNDVELIEVLFGKVELTDWIFE